MPPQGSAYPVSSSDVGNTLKDLEVETRGDLSESEEDSPERCKERRRLIRRRANRVQGRSLELLGHAVEYLVDSRMFMIEPSTAKSEREAVQILMRLSRMVFSECEEVVTVWDRMVGLLERPAERRRGTARQANPMRQL